MRDQVVQPTESDYALVQRCKNGEHSAYDELLTRYRARAVRIAYCLMGDRELAEDIAQEAFVRVFLSIRQLQSNDAFYSWLSKTIARVCADQRRKLIYSEIRTDIEPPDDNNHHVGPEEHIYIYGILSQLSEKLRSVIVLREVAGLDYEDIAESLKVPVGTVRSRLAAAREQFRKLYLSGLSAETEGER